MILLVHDLDELKRTPIVGNIRYGLLLRTQTEWRKSKWRKNICPVDFWPVFLKTYFANIVRRHCACIGMYRHFVKRKKYFIMPH
jgi:hypothetical protein